LKKDHAFPRDGRKDGLAVKAAETRTQIWHGYEGMGGETGRHSLMKTKHVCSGKQEEPMETASSVKNWDSNRSNKISHLGNHN
jgi:hypothetical protein